MNVSASCFYHTSISTKLDRFCSLKSVIRHYDGFDCFIFFVNILLVNEMIDFRKRNKFKACIVHVPREIEPSFYACLARDLLK